MNHNIVLNRHHVHNKDLNNIILPPVHVDLIGFALDGDGLELAV